MKIGTKTGFSLVGLIGSAGAGVALMLVATAIIRSALAQQKRVETISNMDSYAKLIAQMVRGDFNAQYRPLVGEATSTWSVFASGAINCSGFEVNQRLANMDGLRTVRYYMENETRLIREVELGGVVNAQSLELPKGLLKLCFSSSGSAPERMLTGQINANSSAPSLIRSEEFVLSEVPFRRFEVLK